MPLPTLADAEALDAADPLGGYRALFALPDDIIYLDGNSLGALPIATAARVREVVEREWGQGLVRSWNDSEWIDAPRRIGAKIASLIGAKADEVIVADSTSVNAYKLLVAQVRLASARSEILAEAGNFPTDLHIARSVAELLGKQLRVVPPDEVGGAIGGDTAAVILAHVHYRTGYRHDMTALNEQARRHDTRIIWDLSHSVGAVGLDLAGDGAELAVGCGYKYLNGGPGAPAFLYASRALQADLASPIAGWMGHHDPFAFGDNYVPATGIGRFLAGTPPILSLLALETGVDLFLDVDHAALFAKSLALFDLFAQLADARCPELALISSREFNRRGSHISFAHPQAYEIVQALIARGVIGDFRTPDVARFGLTPLYLGYADVWRTVDQIADIIQTGCWREPQFAVRSRVT